MSLAYKNRNRLIILFLLFNYIVSQSQSNAYVKMEEEMEKPLRNYVSVCKQGLLLPGRIFERCEHPKISVIIPMYNEEKNVLQVIRSIQNQSLQELEIVCINDNSNDKTLSILKSLQKDDPRIRIITHKTNRGVLYNRISGALKSNGEYVTFVDADDLICNMNIFQMAYDLATKEYNEKIDIIHYQTCGSKVNINGVIDPFVLFNTFNPNNFNQVIRQPEIGDNYMQKKKNVTGSGLVFDKIYSKELMIRIAKYLGPHIWNQNLSYIDDFLLAFASMKVARNIVNIGQVGYWHYIDQETSTTSNVWEIVGDRLKYPDKTNKKIGDYMTILGRILELTDNEPQMAEFRESTLKELTDKQYMPTIARSVHYNKYLSLFEKLYLWKYIDRDTKKRVKQYVKEILKYRVDSEKKFAHLFK
jgi:glycosyltransferase involved in cell wall biosynthesis